MNTVSFTANYLCHQSIGLKTNNNKIKQQDACLVELDRNNVDDINSIGETTLLWDKIDEDNNDIMWNFYDEMKKDIPNYVNKQHFYALTLQDDNFEKLKPDKILGVVSLSELKNNDYDEIDWLQTHPANNSRSNPAEREYCGIGSAMLDYLQTSFRDKPIYVCSSQDAINFYEKNGFKNCGNCELIYE